MMMATWRGQAGKVDGAEERLLLRIRGDDLQKILQ